MSVLPGLDGSGSSANPSARGAEYAVDPSENWDFSQAVIRATADEYATLLQRCQT